MSLTSFRCSTPPYSIEKSHTVLIHLRINNYAAPWLYCYNWLLFTLLAVPWEVNDRCVIPVLDHLGIATQRACIPMLYQLRHPLFCKSDSGYNISVSYLISKSIIFLQNKKSTTLLWWLSEYTRGYLAGVRFSCISRVSPVIPAACGSDEFFHLKQPLSYSMWIITSLYFFVKNPFISQ